MIRDQKIRRGSIGDGKIVVATRIGDLRIHTGVITRSKQEYGASCQDASRTGQGLSGNVESTGLNLEALNRKGDIILERIRLKRRGHRIRLSSST